MKEMYYIILLLYFVFQLLSHTLYICGQNTLMHLLCRVFELVLQVTALSSKKSPPTEGYSGLVFLVDVYKLHLQARYSFL